MSASFYDRHTKPYYWAVIIMVLFYSAEEHNPIKKLHLKKKMMGVMRGRRITCVKIMQEQEQGMDN